MLCENQINDFEGRWEMSGNSLYFANIGKETITVLNGEYKHHINENTLVFTEGSETWKLTISNELLMKDAKLIWNNGQVFERVSRPNDFVWLHVEHESFDLKIFQMASERPVDFSSLYNRIHVCVLPLAP